MSKVEQFFENARLILKGDFDIQALRERQKRLLAEATDDDLKAIVAAGDVLRLGSPYTLEDLLDSRAFFRKKLAELPMDGEQAEA